MSHSLRRVRLLLGSVAGSVGGRRGLVMGVGLLGALPALTMVLRAGRIPSLDYWWFFPSFFRAGGFVSAGSGWLSAPNEHVLAISFLVYAANIVLAAGSNVGLGLLGWLAAVAQYALLCRAVWQGDGPLPVWRSIWVAFCCTTPAAAHLWIVGFSGVHWCWASLFAISSLEALGRFVNGGRRAWAIAHLGLATVASLTFGSGALVWPVAGWGLWCAGRRRWALLYTLPVLLAMGRYAAAGGAGAIDPSGLRDRVLFGLAFLAGPVSRQLEIAVLVGATGLTLFAGLAWRAGWAPMRAGALWALVGFFAIGNAAVGAVARGEAGAYVAVSSKYTLVAAAFWLALVQLAAIELRRGSAWPATRLAPPVLAVALAIPMMAAGSVYSTPLLARAALQPLVELAELLGVEDDQLTRVVVTPDPTAWRAAVPVLREHHLVPFDKLQPRCPADSLGRTVEIRPGRREAGMLERVEAPGPGVARFSGFLTAAPGREACIELLDERETVRGIGWTTIPIDVTRVRFLGYARFPEPPKHVRAVVVGDQGRIALAGQVVAPFPEFSASRPDPTFVLLRRVGRWYWRGESWWLPTGRERRRPSEAH